jgi:hypothetical protein
MTKERSDELVRRYVPRWGAHDVDYDAAWEGRTDGLRCPAKSMRTAAIVAGWHQMRQILPPEQWSTEACDAIVEATLRTVRDWMEAP